MNAPALVLTDRAANKVRQLREGEGGDDLMLRVYVTGGGCSGFSYGFSFAEAANDDDASRKVGILMKRAFASSNSLTVDEFTVIRSIQQEPRLGGTGFYESRAYQFNQ